jgi:hypothetical protein
MVGEGEEAMEQRAGSFRTPNPTACLQTTSKNKRMTCSGTAASSLLSASTMWPQSRMGRPSSSIWWNTKSRNSFSRYLSPAPHRHPTLQQLQSRS